MANKLKEIASRVVLKHDIEANWNRAETFVPKQGEIITGCNIENAAYGPSNCAERTAIFKAVSEGKKEFTAIAVVGGKAGEELEFCTPCGVCRQALVEFCDPKTFVVYLGTGTEEYKGYLLEELLPYSFTPKNVL